MPIGRPAKYPWHIWLDGGVHKVVPNEHYDPNEIDPDVMRRQILLRARKEGKAIKTTVKNGWILIEPVMMRVDWDEVFAKNTAFFEAGKDFVEEPEQFAAKARAAAARRGLKAHITTGGQVVEVSAYRPPSSEWTKKRREEQDEIRVLGPDEQLRSAPR